MFLFIFLANDKNMVKIIDNEKSIVPTTCGAAENIGKITCFHTAISSPVFPDQSDYSIAQHPILS
jgi:hypothetical protein